MAAGEMVIVGYRPHPGQAAELERLVADHVPILRRLGLATDRPALAMRAADGTVIEVFEWQPGGIERAHADPQAGALWARLRRGVRLCAAARAAGIRCDVRAVHPPGELTAGSGAHQSRSRLASASTNTRVLGGSRRWLA